MTSTLTTEGGGGRGAADRGQARRPHRRRRAVGRSDHGAAASFVRRASGRQLQAARGRSALRVLRRAATWTSRRRSAPKSARDSSTGIASRSGIHGGGERAGGAHHLLRRSRRPRADPHPRSSRARLVEPGVRGGRLPQRVPRRAAPGGRRSDGRAIQHHHLGASIHARLELRLVGDRSADRRDHQGPRLPRIAARAAGLPDRRGPAVAVHDRHREAAGPHRHGASRGCASCRRTRSATRSGSATTTTTARWAGSR